MNATTDRNEAVSLGNLHKAQPYSLNERSGDTSNLAVARSLELEELLSEITPRLLQFIRKADEARAQHQHTTGGGSVAKESDSKSYTSSLLPTEKAVSSLLRLDEHGLGAKEVGKLVDIILENSINTSAPGFMDKLYAAPLPPGVVSELILGVLNTNIHVFSVSPILTLIEKRIGKDLAGMFGLAGPRSGGISVQGGSASNLTSIVVARNTLYPETKSYGNGGVRGQLVLYTSAHGHYSIEKAAQALGFGTKSVVSVPTDRYGRMRVDLLSSLIVKAQNEGNVPFYINATAGTTVLGSFDPFREIAEVAKRYGMWLHIDGAWGGSFVFSQNDVLRKRLAGAELADSIAINPHKMLGVPLTCSFLLGNDLRQFQEANTLKAGYLFHDDVEVDSGTNAAQDVESTWNDDSGTHKQWQEPYDLADLTLQCGRRGDSLKFFLSWKSYGSLGFGRMIDEAYETACYMTRLVEAHASLTSVIPNMEFPSCLQVCFHFTPGGRFYHELAQNSLSVSPKEATNQAGKLNSWMTSSIAKALAKRSFQIDYAPPLQGQEDQGSFFRVVIHISTVRGTVERLLNELICAGENLVTRSLQKSLS